MLRHPSLFQADGHARQEDCQEHVRAGETGHRDQNRDPAQERRLDRLATQPPERLEDDGDHDRLDPVEQRGELWQATEAEICLRDGHDHGHCREDETDAPEQQTGPTGPEITEIDRHLGGVRAGDQVDRAQQVQKLFAGDPPTTPDHFALHHGDVRSGTAESGCA